MRTIKIFLFASLVLANAPVFAQKKIGNQVIIKPEDNYQTIINKAANVKPSGRQLRWQQLELTAFFHFFVNTFTNKE